MARMLSLLGLVALGTPVLAAEQARDRVVFVGHHLDAEQVVVLGSALSAAREPGVLLLDSERARPHVLAFLKAYAASELVSIGKGAKACRELRTPANLTGPHIDWPGGPPFELWKQLLPESNRVVVCPPRPYRLLLQAACLAGLSRAPLYVYRESPEARVELFAFLRRQGVRWVYAVGECGDLSKRGRESFSQPSRPALEAKKGAQKDPDPFVTSWHVERFADEDAVQAACVQRLEKHRPILDFVAANPADRFYSEGAMSPLAPWLALRRRALLLLTNPHGSDVAALLANAERRFKIQGDHLLLAADLRAIPVERRPNPTRGKDEWIEMEPTTPSGNETYTYAVGRLFHEEPAIVPLVLAGQRLLRPRGGDEPHRALVASNSAGELPLLETFSRTTAKELANRGFLTTTLFGDGVNPRDVRQLLPEQDIFLWEGHHNTLIKNYGFSAWNERLSPSLFFLQSCLVLQPEKTATLFERGVLGVVGSSTRIYSASGGAFALSYFNALLYEKRTLGGALRHAKNFMVCYAKLKDKRLGSDARLTAVNLRSAWAFSLWGDPGLRLPLPERPAESLAAVKPRAQAGSIRLKVPREAHDTKTSRYEVQVPANGRLAGLIVDEEGCDRLVPLVFAEVPLPDGAAGSTPTLRTRLPEKCWSWCWDGRRRVAYVLVAPGCRHDIRLQVDWDSERIGGE